MKQQTGFSLIELVIVACMVLILALGIFTPMWDMMRAVRGH